MDDVIAKWGRNALHLRANQPGVCFLGDEVSGGIAYVDGPRARLSMGPSLCAMADQWATYNDYVARSKDVGKAPLLFGLYRADLAPGWHKQVLAKEPLWQPQQWGISLRMSANLREQLRRARAKGAVCIHLDALTPAAEALSTRWLESRGMSPLGYAAKRRGFANATAFAVEQDERIIAACRVGCLPHTSTWHIEDMVRTPEACNGAIELLIDHVMAQACANNVTWLGMGMVPLAGAHGPLALIRSMSQPLYHFEGLRRFREKLRPHRWEPVFLSWPRMPGIGRFRAVFHLLRAFADQPLPRFALTTVRHQFGRATVGLT